MEPGKTYIAKLPSRSRPAFVRRRRDTIETPFGLTAIARALGPVRPRLLTPGPPPPPLPASTPSGPTDQSEREPYLYPVPNPPYSIAAPRQPTLQIENTGPPQDTYQTGAPTACLTQIHYVPIITAPQPQISASVATPDVIEESQPEEPMLHRHKCSSCGKFRSPSYNLRHPLVVGKVPEPSICRKCINERTSSERSNANDESYHRKRDRRRKYRERRKDKVNYGRTGSLEEIQNSDSNMENIRITRRVRSVSRGPEGLHRSWTRSRSKLGSKSRSKSGSQSRSSSAHRLFISDRRQNREERSSMESAEVVGRTRYVQPTYQSRLRLSSRGPPAPLGPDMKISERVVRQHSPDLDRPRIYPATEVYRPREDGTIVREYNDQRNEEYTRGPMPRRFVSMLAGRDTRVNGQEEDYLDPPPYTDYVPSDRRIDRSSYDYNPSLDEAPHHPTRSVRIVRVRTGNDSVMQLRDKDCNPIRVQNPRATFAESSSRSQSSKSICLESEQTAKHQRRRRYQDTGSFSKQGSSDDYSALGKIIRFSVP